MKKLFLSGMIISLLLFGCQKDETSDYASLILGSWINTQVDNEAILTDKSYALEFRADHVEIFASGYVIDANNKTWIENDQYTYSVTGKKIIIDGSNEAGSLFHMEFEIRSIDQNTLVYSVSKFTVDNVEYPDNKTYTSRHVTEDFADQFAGTWYGKSTTPGSSDTSYHYWDYFADGHYDYYFQDSLGNWINKPDNEGVYFLYGDLMASNYTNDLLSGGTGKAYECWNFDIEADTMSWTGLRENGLTTSYRMEKVANPPVILK
jgi:hypothetical protein